MARSGAAERAVDSAVVERERVALGLLGAGLLALLTGLGAQVHIPMPPDGVPMTLQTLMVLLSALCLGPRYGTVSMLLYVSVGIVGGAVFAEGSKGLLVLMGQTGGYIVGFVLCQPVVGVIVRRRDGSVRGWGAMIAAVLAAHAVVFAIGVPWLGIVNGFTVERALEGGFYPFVIPMLAKSAVAVWIGRVATPWASKRFW